MLKQLMTLFTILLCSALFSLPTIADHIKDTENKDKADPPITMVQMNKPIGCVPDGKKLTKRINEMHENPIGAWIDPTHGYPIIIYWNSEKNTSTIVEFVKNGWACVLTLGKDAAWMFPDKVEKKVEKKD